MTKKIVSIIAAAAVAFSVSAQSARIQGLAGSSLISDPSNLISAPSYIPTYKDVFQATFDNADAVTEIFANKSIGDMFSLGFYWDQQKLTSNFYSTAGPLVGGDFVNLTGLSQRVPHLVLGVDLDNVKLGADLFFENATYRYSLEQNVIDPSVDDVAVEEDGRVSNPGILLGAELEVGDMGLLVNGGISFPNVKIEEWDNGEDESYVSLDSEKGLFFTIAAQLNLELLDIDWSVGAGIEYETHQFVTTNGADSLSQATPALSLKNNYLTVGILLGAMKELQNNLVLSVEDNFSINSDKTTSADSAYAEDPDISTVTLLHNLAFGIEKKLTNTKRLDNIALRFGMNYDIETTILKAKGDGESLDTNVTETIDLHDEREKDGTEWGPFEAVIGLGVEKGRFGLDVFMTSGIFNPSNWAFSATSGSPSALAGASVTFDFNKKSSSKSVVAEPSTYKDSAPAESYSSPEPTFESAPAEETTSGVESSSDSSFDF